MNSFFESHITSSNVHIRWMVKRDMPFVHSIERQSFEHPWSEEDWIRSSRQRDCIGMVAEQNEEVVGFMIYELHPQTIHVLNFAVHPDARRQGVGRTMVGKLTSKLSPRRRNTIVLEVRETNLIGQQFFRSLGFRAVRVLRDFYNALDCSEDAYQMRYRSRIERTEKPDMKT